ncbi:hypothetical protein BASA81_010804 [Batrachochytrium salamandrivorans]|nr:hypothetical protein BASA81_010804 [Batrachochytrium salamandrivorans]
MSGPINWLDFGLTCLVVLGISILSQTSDVLAAAFSTAPISSTVALTLWYYRGGNHSSAKSPEELGEFALKIIKGVSASLVFACAVWFASAKLKLSLPPALLLGYMCWTGAWFVLYV